MSMGFHFGEVSTCFRPWSKMVNVITFGQSSNPRSKNRKFHFLRSSYFQIPSVKYSIRVKFGGNPRLQIFELLLAICFFEI
jgi:hypothetical protein